MILPHLVFPDIYINIYIYKVNVLLIFYPLPLILNIARQFFFEIWETKLLHKIYEVILTEYEN
jgi:hypothetical protein